MLKILSPIERYIFTIPLKRLYSILWFIQLIKTGIWCFPFLGNPIDPFTVTFRPGYRFSSWLTFFLAWCLQIKSKYAFVGMFFVFALGFSWIVYKCMVKYLSDEAARKAIIIFFLLPVSGTIYYWVDLDAITLFLMALVLYKLDSWPVALFGGMALGLNHFEQSFVAFSALSFAMILFEWSFQKHIVRMLGCVLLGIFLGKLGLILLFHYQHIFVHTRSQWMLSHVPRLWYEFFYSIHIILWSVLGLAWMVALAYAEQGRKTIPFFLALLGLIAFIPFAEDQTRVISIISFPLLMVFWLKNEDFLQKLSKSLLAFLCLIWIFIPWTWVWQSAARNSAFPFDVVFVLHKTLGWFEIPAEQKLGTWIILAPETATSIPLRTGKTSV